MNMKTALIIHGIGGHAGIHWQGWLKDELIKKGYKVLMPDLPNPDHPDRQEWLQTLIELVKDVNFSNLTIIGHSLGVTTALDFLESLGKSVNTLISVSGFAEDYGAELNSYFLKERKIDFANVRKLTGRAHVIYGEKDPYVPQVTLRSLADKLGAEPIVIKNGGHLNTDSGYTTFPLLLEFV